ncbi:MAG: glycosyltransferase [candidate division Zixibacteria bacterium]|nr:glycosyltransferase [candidate division Zixibacteria bacterium]
MPGIINTNRKIVILGNAASVHIRRWAKGISDSGLGVTVISYGGKEIEGIETILLGGQTGKRLGYIGLLSMVRRAIRKIAPDLVHSHYATGYGLWGKYSDIHPFIISVWGSDIVEFPSNGLKRWGLRRILLAADYVTATSEFLKSQTLMLAPETASRIAVIPFGVEIPPARSPRQSAEVRLIFMKAHQRKYGPDILLKALHLLSDRGKHIVLTMAGTGELTDDLKSMVHEFLLDDRVKFVGYIENDQVPSILAEHDIMVMPSLAESFGVAALEGAAVGLPVIASDVGGIPEVVEDGETGILVRPGDPESLAEAIMKLASDVELRKRMGKAGKEMVGRKYRWQASIDQMVQLYERLMMRKRA